MQITPILSLAAVVMTAGLAIADEQARWLEPDGRTCAAKATSYTGAGIPNGYLCCRDCPGGRLAVPRAQWLSPTEISRKLAVQGYRVQEIEAKREAYEFEATNSSGTRIEAYAHPATGEVLPQGVLCCAPCLGI